LDAAGTFVWGYVFGDLDDQYARTVAVDATGNIVVAGEFRGTLELGGDAQVAGADWAVFVAKLDPAGNVTYSQSFTDLVPASTTNHSSLDLAIDSTSGHVVLAGVYDGDGKDLFVRRLTDSLTPYDGPGVWPLLLEGPGDQDEVSVAFSAYDRIVVAGTFSDSRIPSISAVASSRAPDPPTRSSRCWALAARARGITTVAGGRACAAMRIDIA
jgi:hypothetical protein